MLQSVSFVLFAWVGLKGGCVLGLDKIWEAALPCESVAVLGTATAKCNCNYNGNGNIQDLSTVRRTVRLSVAPVEMTVVGVG